MKQLTPTGAARRPGRGVLVSAALTAAVLAMSACGAPGASSSSGSSATAQAISTSVGTAKTTLTVHVASFEEPAWKAMGALFTQKYPNVTVNVTGEDANTINSNAPRLFASGSVPDVARATLGIEVKDKLITDLDPYAKLYGWDAWPQAQFATTRQLPDWTVRGTGPLWAVGNGYGLTGVYYNTAILSKIGGSEPQTLADFVTLMQKAKTAGYIGLETNGHEGGVAYPLQNLAIDYGGAAPVQQWVSANPGASINTPAMVKAAQTIQDWKKAGYLDPNIVSLSNETAPTDFAKGKTLFYPSGNWEAPTLDKAMPGKVGFFLFPGVSASDPKYAMSASETLMIPSKSQHKNVAAAFLNFIQTDAQARQVTVSQGGLVPGGPVGASIPQATGSAAQTLTAFAAASKNNALIDFLANATTSMTNTIIPQTQLLVTDRTTPAAFAAKLQSDFTSQLGG